MWCKMASQLTAEQQQMNCCFAAVMNSVMHYLPENLSVAPWSFLTATVFFLTAVMFIFMSTLNFLTYMFYTALVSALFLRYKQCIFVPSWSRRMIYRPEMR